MNSPVSEVSTDPRARARKLQSAILQRLGQHGVQARLATELQVDESTVSRWKSDLERTTQILSLLGLKVVDENKVCVRPDEIGFLRKVYQRVCELAPWVMDEDAE